MKKRILGTVLFLIAAGPFVAAQFKADAEAVAGKFAEQDRVYVTVLLEHPEWPRDTAEQKGLADHLQTMTLETELAEGFETVRRFETIPALSGWIDLAAFRRWQDLKSKNLSGIRGIGASVGGRAVEPRSGGSGGLTATIPHIRADLAHAMGFTGAGVEVAVLDSGVQSGHPDLSGGLLAEHCFCFNPNGNCCPDGQSEQSGAGSALDEHGHGTHVSGIVASDGNQAGVGVAPDVQFTAVRVLDSNNGFYSINDVSAALDWLNANRPNVRAVNMSLYTNAHFADVCDNAAVWTQTLSMAAQNLAQKGVLLVGIAGNDGLVNQLPAPGCISQALAIGATNIQDAAAGFSTSDDGVDLFAPGVLVSSTFPTDTTALLSGTSMAAPHVTGLAAILAQADPSLTPDRMLEIMRDTGVAVSDGVGLTRPRIDAKAALDAALANGQSSRWVPHVTRDGGGFLTDVYLKNQSGAAINVTLHPYDVNGVDLGEQTFGLNPNEVRRMSSSQAFPGQAASHFAIEGPDSVEVGVGYRTSLPLGGTAHVRESRMTGRVFTLYPAEWDVVFDGMALINLGDAAATVQADQVDYQGASLATVDYTAGSPLAPHGKLLAVFSVDFQERADAYLRIESSQPAMLVLLRGSYPGAQPAYLYQTAPIIEE